MPQGKTDPSPPSPEHPEAKQLQPILQDALAAAVRKLLHRSRAEIGRAARSGRELLELRQHQKDLDQFWVRLGKTAYHLVEGGEIDHPALRRAMSRIDELEASIEALRRRKEDSEGPAPESE